MRRPEAQRPSRLNQLISGPGSLAAPHPRGQTVATPQNLPSMIQYGHMPPGRAQSSDYTGAVSRNQSTVPSLASDPTGYTPPSYPSLTSGAPGAYTGGVNPLHLLLALALSGMGGSGGGGAPGAASALGHTPVPGAVPKILPQTKTNPGSYTGATKINPGAYTGAAKILPQTKGGPVSGGLLASLALQGQKLGSRSGSAY